MTEAVQSYLQILKERSYRKGRTTCGIDISELVGDFDYSDPRLNAIRFEALVKREVPVLFPNDPFGFHRYQADYPTFTLKSGEVGTNGGRGNITPNYARVISRGFDETEREIRAYRAQASDPEKLRFYDTVLSHFPLMRALIAQYRDAALRTGCTRLADALQRIPQKPAQTFYEACLFLQIIIYFLRCSPHSHLTLGRFDQ